MSINITQTMNSFQQFENRENLRNTAKQILNNKGASKEGVNRIMEATVFDYQPQLAIIKASSQISVNNSLKETLKYLKSHAAKRQAKEPVLGELWNIFTSKEISEENELFNFEIDENAENIFAA